MSEIQSRTLDVNGVQLRVVLGLAGNNVFGYRDLNMRRTAGANAEWSTDVQLYS
jgi:hypothetical protein